MTSDHKTLWLAPLRGVTIRAFRRVFANAIKAAGFDGAITPFIPANPGIRVGPKLFADLEDGSRTDFTLVPQIIGKHPDALRILLKGLKDKGFTRADLNAGCPFPMIRNKGRGSGLLHNPDMLERMLAVGCEEMGPGNFSLKTRLGFASSGELSALMPMICQYPLAMITIHARTAIQMYEGTVNNDAYTTAAALSTIPVVRNGDAETTDKAEATGGLMVGRAFLRALGRRDDARELISNYLVESRAELCGEAPVLGRMKELLAYWAEGSIFWRHRWSAIKICRSMDELVSVI